MHISKSHLIFLFALAVLCNWTSPIPAAAQSWPNGYVSRRVITIDHTKVPNTDQTNFPLLISGTYSYLATTGSGGKVTNANGYDIVFASDSDGFSPLPYERQSYNASTGAVNFWVQVPTLSHTSDTVIYIFYGNSSVTTDQSNAVAVWDSYYQGVWHFNQTPNGAASERDSTSNGFHATPASSGISLSPDGIAGSSLFFDGSNFSNVVTMSSALPGGAPLTVSTWIKTDGENSTAQSLGVNKSTWSSMGWSILDDGQYNAYTLFRSLPNYNYQVTVPRSSLNNGVWHYLVGTLAGSTLDFYFDGALQGSTSFGSMTSDTTDPVTVGGFGGNQGGGLLTEVRISNAPRSADWIATEYHNQSNPATFYTIQGSDWSNGYAFSRAIKIDHTKIPNTDEINFPVLVSGTYSYLATTGNGGNVTSANGYDIIFTSDADGTSPLAYERQAYNPSTGAISYWVKVPRMSHTSDTVIYLFYGNASIATDQSNAIAVWDSNYKGVWHFNQTPNGTASEKDSTSNGYHGTPASSGVSLSSDGIAGSSLRFDGVSSSNNVTMGPGLPGIGPLTASLWVKTTGLNSTCCATMVDKSTWNTYGWSMIDNASYGSYVLFRTLPNNGSTQDSVPRSSVNNGIWHYLVGTIDSSKSMGLYFDGTSQGSLIVSPTADTVDAVKVGGFAGNTGGGLLTEVRISNIPRSPDWITTEFNNQSNPSTFYSVIATPPSVASLSPTSGPAGTAVTITGSNFGSTQGSSIVTFRGSTATPTSWSNTSIVVPIPSGATTGNLVVIVSNVSSNGVQFTVTSPTITRLSPALGGLGEPIAISGTNFGSSQGSSTVTFNGTTATPVAWSDTNIGVPVPNGATSGNVVVTVSGIQSNGLNFHVTSVPFGWLDMDMGSVGVAGNATYANGAFTINASGQYIYNNADSGHIVYKQIAGDVTMIARLVSLQGGASTQEAGLLIRETLDPSAKNVYMAWGSGGPYLAWRAIPWGSTSSQTANNVSLPSWLKLVRSGNTFTGYSSQDGANWTQVSLQTVNMATDVYVALATSSEANTSLDTAVFDNVSISTATSPAPVITALSRTTASVGNQVVITGANFGASQGSSLVTLNTLPMTINSWSNTSITVAIAPGAVSGSLLVLVGPTMNDSNAVYFEVTPNPLPLGWFDLDIGHVGAIGGSGYTAGTFTISGEGNVGNNVDAFHFVYQTLSGDGTIIARLVNPGATTQSGVMIRESLASNSTNVYLYYSPVSAYFSYRSSTGGSTTTPNSVNLGLPGWLKLTRSGSTFSSYISPDRTNWTQLGPSTTINMAQNVYIGMAVSGSSSNSTTFDNVSVDASTSPAPVITSVSATTGSIGSQIVISGANFGASQGSSLVTLNSIPLTINSWSGTSITITISAGAASGPMLVSIGPSMNDSNYVYLTVTPNPLPNGWFDQDIGSPGIAGGASYANGTFTVSGGGVLAVNGTTDSLHIAYQTLSGDGTIIARLLNSDSGKLMMRETLTPTSAVAYLYYYIGYSSAYFATRSSTGASLSTQGPLTSSFPVWMKLTRTGNTVSGYVSPDGVYWTQVGNSVTISMAQAIYVGLESNSGSTGTLAAAVFDNVSITAGTPTPTPIVTGIMPTSGTIGASVTVTGSNFGTTQGGSSVRFNGAIASSVTSWSNGQVVAAVPSNASTGPVTVVVNSTGSNKDYVFTFYNPVISSATPPAAEVGGHITLSGTGFGSTQGSSTVRFNGLTASISSWSDTKVVAIVPASATTGPITLTEGGITSNSVQFTVIEPVSVTGISPALGPVGTTVTITGAGFGPTQSNSVASFYRTPATITSWSDTSIVALVPAGTSTGPVSVQVAGVTVWGPQFTLTSTLQVTDSLGNTSSYTSAVVGGNWYVTDSTGSGCSTCTQRGVIHKTYDAQGNVLTQTDELGRTSTYTYDSKGNVLSSSQPDGNGHTLTTSYTYNSLNEVLTTTDPLGNVTTNSYDAHGNLLTVTTPKPNSSTAASVTQFAYNSLGQMTQITDPLSHNTILTYTPAGLIATVKDAQNNVTTYGYDTHGNRTSVTDALNHQTTFAYDTGDRLTTITYPDTTTSSFTYDSRGRRTSVTDQNGKLTTYAYDDADRLTSVTDAANNVTTYGYDTENNLTSIKDANNNTTSFTPDAFGRVTKTTFPSGYVETYNYDAVGNLLNKTDRKNQLITYAYDGLNRLTQKSYPDSTTVNYTYDLDSRLTQVTDPTGTYQFTFDNMGRLTAATTSYTFLTARNFTTGYSYDAASNRTGFTDPENGSTAYVYDTLNRLQTLTPPSAFSGTGSFGFSYDALNRRTQMTRPNNVATNYAYDNLSRLQSVLHQLAGSTIDGATYTVDNAGNRTAKTDQRAGITSNYGYDAIYELTGVTQGTNTTESYTYDPVGNRLSSIGVSPYSVNVSNQLTSTPSTSYTYDNNGNMLTKTDSTGTTNYAWDFENRLTGVTLPSTGGSVTFKYDPFGRRIQKSFTTGANPPTATATNYLYDGDNSIEEVDPNGGVLARYSQNLNIDEPLAMLRGGATSYYHADGLGSITSLSNGTGALAQTYTIDSFGRQTASSGSLTNPFRYTGREFDSESALYYMRARYFDPTSGKFISEDPLSWSSRDSNFYEYVLNNPMNLVDPLGWNAQAVPLPFPTRPGGPILVPSPGTGTSAFPWGPVVGGVVVGIVGQLLSPVPLNSGEDQQLEDALLRYHRDQARKKCPNNSGCNPCIPPVGTISYRLDTTPGVTHRGVLTPHWHLFVMQQNPTNCQCQWVDIKDNQGGFGNGNPPNGTVPISGPAGGGRP